MDVGKIAEQLTSAIRELGAAEARYAGLKERINDVRTDVAQLLDKYEKQTRELERRVNSLEAALDVHRRAAESDAKEIGELRSRLTTLEAHLKGAFSDSIRQIADEKMDKYARLYMEAQQTRVRDERENGSRAVLLASDVAPRLEGEVGLDASDDHALPRAQPK